MKGYGRETGRCQILVRCWVRYEFVEEASASVCSMHGELLGPGTRSWSCWPSSDKPSLRVKIKEMSLGLSSP